jgi:hypothetical protein
MPSAAADAPEHAANPWDDRRSIARIDGATADADDPEITRRHVTQ